MTPSKRCGFSLLELLVVIAVIAIMAALAVSGFHSITGANSITSSADRIAAALDLARQSAMTKNKKIEVRFYEAPALGWTNDFRAFQIFEIGDSGSATPLTKSAALGTPTIIARDTGLSTLLLSEREKTNWTTNDPRISIPNAGTGYVCRYLQFRPDGSTDLPVDGKWHLTIVDAKAPGSAAEPPANFACIWVEPVSGAVRVLRP
jgi:uncharacterized protein (TIGR02596 family)